MVSNSKNWTLVYLRGLAQVGFSESPWAGLLVLGAIVVLAPWSAAGACVGGLVGLVAGRFQKNLGGAQWEAGVSGFNPAIVGIFWGLTYAAGEAGLGILALLLAVCVGIEYVMRPVFVRLQLPLLSMPAMVTAYLAAGMFALSDAVFWQHLPPLVPGNYGLALAAAMIGAAIATQSLRAAALTAFVVAMVLGAAELPGFSLIGAQGLWAFTVGPVVFGIYGVFLPNSNRGALAALFGAGLAALFWISWVSTPLQSLAPPSLVPFILATWITLTAFSRLSQRAGARSRAVDLGGGGVTGLSEGGAAGSAQYDRSGGQSLVIAPKFAAERGGPSDFGRTVDR